MKDLLKYKLEEVLNSSLTGDKLRLALEQEIAKIFPYNHEEHSPVKACGLDEDFEFQLAHVGTISEAVEKVEKSVSKRQLSYMFLKAVIGEKPKKIQESPQELSNWIEALFRPK